MKTFNILVLLSTVIFHLLCFSEKLAAQSVVNNEIMETDSFLIKLPNLETLIDSAIAHAPELKIQSFIVQLKEHEIKVAKKNWTKDIVSGSANVNYGIFDNFIVSQDLGISQLNTNSSQQTRYNVGMSVKIPIATAFDHSNEKKAKIELERMAFDNQLLIKELRDKVFSKHNQLIDCYQKYKILSGEIASYDILEQHAKNEFSRNQISLTEIINLNMTNSNAKLDFHTAKSNLKKAIWELQELTGIELKF